MIFARDHGVSSVAAVIERQTRFVVLLANDDRRPKRVAGRIDQALSPLPTNARRTLTLDHGFEFLDYGAMPAKAFFRDPQKPWRKGFVENANGRVRRALPRRTPPEARDAPTLARVAAAVNATPRKRLGRRAPADAFHDQLAMINSPASNTPKRLQPRSARRRSEIWGSPRRRAEPRAGDL